MAELTDVWIEVGRELFILVGMIAMPLEFECEALGDGLAVHEASTTVIITKISLVFISPSKKQVIAC